MSRVPEIATNAVKFSLALVLGSGPENAQKQEYRSVLRVASGEGYRSSTHQNGWENISLPVGSSPAVSGILNFPAREFTLLKEMLVRSRGKR